MSSMWKMIVGSPPRGSPHGTSPLASPTSPPGQYMAGGGMRSSASTSQIAQAEDPEKYVIMFGRYFTSKLVQILVQARQNEKYDSPCNAAQHSDWFNLRVDELGEVSVQMRKSINEYPPTVECVCIDFILYTADNETLPLETWCFSWESSKTNPFTNSAFASFDKNTKSKVYADLGMLLRSSMCAARMTPMHRYYVKKQSAETFVITYRILTGRSTIELGADCKRKRLGTVNTPIGYFHLDVAYRMRMEIERSATPASSESFQQVHISPGTSPGGGRGGGGGTPNSFCDVTSQCSNSPGSQFAASPPNQWTGSARSRTASEASIGATSEGTAAGTSPPLPGQGQVQPPSASTTATLTPQQEEKEEEEEEEDMMRSRASEIRADVPFANLLMSAYTGILVSNLDKEQEAKLDKPDVDEDEDPEDEQGISTTTSIRTVTAVKEEEEDDIEQEEKEKEEEEGDEMTETIKDDYILRASDRSLAFSPLGDPPKKKHSASRGSLSSDDSDSEKTDEEGTGSYVTVPFVATSAEQLPDMIMQCRYATIDDIEGGGTFKAGELVEDVTKQLSMFAGYQGGFDALVAAVRESVEEDEREEREYDSRTRTESGASAKASP